MIKTQEVADPQSCLNHAKPDEMLFVLLGRDPAAPAAIRAWIAERIRLGKNQPSDDQIYEAENCALRIENDQRFSKIQPGLRLEQKR